MTRKTRPLWITVLLILLCVVADMATWILQIETFEVTDREIYVTSFMILFAVVTWVLLPFALHHSRRERNIHEEYPGHPVALIAALLVLALGGFRPLSLSVLVVLISLISRGRLRWSLAGTVVLVVSYVTVMAVPYLHLSYLSVFGYGFFGIIVLVVAWITGSVRAQRRQREVTLVSLAELNEDQLRSREERARLEERNRIARDIHDSLSHRLSLISVYAGGLSYRKDADPERIAEAAGTIQSEAKAAVEDLRGVIKALRVDDRVDPRASIEEHIERARAAGTKVRYEKGDAHERIDNLGTLAAHTLGRAVQEGLTNARKYAPGQKVTLRVENEEDKVRVTMQNKKVAAQPESGGGNGLLGLEERARLAGGTFTVLDDASTFTWVLELPEEAHA
ncbi:sensor histidine kinase [Corynebacterium minutissimum]|uniref:histidine kinase n=1 Tax=Corynebacterium minutissimum TaxID=38301 RepID=A0A376D3V9_9CORY|nr:histidine kinase [Corynebacterium minutissimum]STC80200.1 two-component system sensor histidine kinase [Corynebacterium minutissimum]